MTKRVERRRRRRKPVPRIDASDRDALSSTARPSVVPVRARREHRPGYAGTPVNANGQLPDFLFGLGVAGRTSRRLGSYYVSVDSGRDPFTGQVLCQEVRPALVGQRREASEGPGSSRPDLERPPEHRGEGHRPARAWTGYRMQLLVHREAADPPAGDALRPADRDRRPPDPAERAAQPGTQFMKLVASDFQESKNVDTEANAVAEHPVKGSRGSRSSRPAVTWVTPAKARLRFGRGAAPGRGERQRPDLLGRVLRREAPDRPRQQEHGRPVPDDLANEREDARVRTCSTAVASDIRGRQGQAAQTIRVCK